MDVERHTIAVVGGTGPQGKGLAYRFARHEHEVIVGSRSADRAAETATEIRERGVTGQVSGATNEDAVAAAGIVVIAVPWDGYLDTVTALAGSLAGKIVVSCVNPIAFDDDGPYALPLERSAAEQTAELAPDATVVGAFHLVSAKHLWNDKEYLSYEDVPIVGDDPEAVDVVVELAATVTGRRGITAGRLRLARQLEPFTALIISANKAYRTSTGFKMSGLKAKLEAKTKG